MPVYNAERFIESSVKSILTQTLKDFELLIIDDGSTDNSVSIVKSVKDSRIILFENEKRGISHQLNFGISQASADLIARMDADDISQPSRLERQLSIILNNPELDIVGSNIIFIDLYGKQFGYKKYPQVSEDITYFLPIEMTLCHASTLMRKRLFDSKIHYQNEYEPVEDHKLFLEIAESNYKFYNIQEFLYFYRIDNSFHNKIKKTHQVLKSYHLGVEFLRQSKDYLTSYDYYFRRGLIEYYNGNIAEARKHLIECFSFSNHSKLKLLRYILPTLLGEKIFMLLKKNKIFYKINFYLKKYFNFDTHKFYRT